MEKGADLVRVDLSTATTVSEISQVINKACKLKMNSHCGIMVDLKHSSLRLLEFSKESMREFKEAEKVVLSFAGAAEKRGDALVIDRAITSEVG
jgi:pyruvate kinase